MKYRFSYYNPATGNNVTRYTNSRATIRRITKKYGCCNVAIVWEPDATTVRGSYEALMKSITDAGLPLDDVEYQQLLRNLQYTVESLSYCKLVPYEYAAQQSEELEAVL